MYENLSEEKNKKRNTLANNKEIFLKKKKIKKASL